MQILDPDWLDLVLSMSSTETCDVMGIKDAGISTTFDSMFLVFESEQVTVVDI